jgi:tetratricopeptide (TPR) repeat protein
LDLALEFASKAVEIGKNNVRYIEFYISTLANVSDHSKAAVLCQSLIKSNPENQRFYTEAINLYIKARQNEQALNVFDQYDKKFGYNAEMLTKKIRLYKNIGQDAKAVKELESLVKKYPKEVSIPLLLANYLSETSKKTEAKKYYSKVLSMDNTNAEANVAMAKYLLQEKDTIGYFEKITYLIKDPNQSPETKYAVLEPFLINISATLDTRFLNQIFPLLKQVNTLHPDFNEMLVSYGLILTLMEKYDEASSVLEKYLISEKRIRAAWVYLLKANEKSYRYANLLKNSKQFVELFPDQAIANYYRGYALLKYADYASAQKFLKRAVDMSFNEAELNALSKSALAVALSANMDAKSDQLVNESLKSAPDNPDILYNVSQSYLLKKDNFGKSEQYINKLLSVNPKDPYYNALQAGLLYRQSKYSESKIKFEQSFSFSLSEDVMTDDVVLLESYGDVLFKLNKIEEAKSYWKKALSLGSLSAALNKKIESLKID